MQKIIAIVVVVIVIAGGSYWFSGRSSTPEGSETEIARIETEAPVAIEEVPELASDDNSAEAIASALPYTASVSYLTPSRTSHDMEVTLIINSNGIVEDASIVYDNGDGFSNGHQERFDNNYRSLVVGQSLETIDLATVAGASLTTEAFNEAVAKVRAERT
jgi:hypothetical protein